MEVIKPSEIYFEEYLKVCQESYDNNIEEWKPFNPDHFEQWKARILEVYSNYEHGVDIPAEMPRMYTYWCVEENTFIGEIQLRPFLNDMQAKTWGHISYAIRYSKWNQGYGTLLLKEALEKAKAFQLTDVYVACRASNIGSIKVIEKNKGQWIKSINDTEDFVNNVYHIAIS